MSNLWKEDATVEPAPATSSQRNLLLVQSDTSQRTLMTSMLEALGYPVATAQDEQEALGLLAHRPFGLVLLGAEPDEARARDFLLQLRRRTSPIPAILLSKSDKAERAQDAVRRGASAVLRVPVPTSRLRAAVLQAMGLGDGHAVRPTPAPASTPEAQERLELPPLMLPPPVPPLVVLALAAPAAVTRPAIRSPKAVVVLAEQIKPLKEALKEPERRIILEALEAFDWGRQETADALGIDRSTLFKKMREYQIAAPLDDA
jgi:DNA-binding NtrC family response regulator